MQPRIGPDYSQAKVIVLAGAEWFVPTLAIRQNRVVLPRMLRVLPLIDAAKDPASDAYLEMFSEETLDIFSRIVHAALTRAYDLTYEEFLDLPISPQELVSAIPGIVEASAFFKKPEGPSNSGETEATT